MKKALGIGELRMGFHPQSHHPESSKIKRSRSLLAKYEVFQMENSEAGHLGLGPRKTETPVNLVEI